MPLVVLNTAIQRKCASLSQTLQKSLTLHQNRTNPEHHHKNLTTPLYYKNDQKGCTKSSACNINFIRNTSAFTMIH